MRLFGSRPERAAGDRPPAPFVVGMNRSGTTLVRMMLDAHPELAIPPETHFVPDLLRACNQRGATPESALAAMKSHREWEDFGFRDEEILARLGALDTLRGGEAARAFYATYAERAGKPRWGDKTPRYVLKMRLIQRHLPEARFVHVIRDGRDVALSVLDRTVREDVDAAEVARRWRRKVERARDDAAALSHYLEVRYEDLVADPEPVLRRVCEFIELPWDAAVLDYHERSAERLREMERELPAQQGARELSVERRMATHRRTTAPPDTSRVSRWRDQMGAADRAAFERVAGTTLAGLGYPLDDTPSVAFLICVEGRGDESAERGQLEHQGILFAESLRRWGGRFAACAIHAYAPREGHGIAARTAARLEQLGVTLHNEAINRDHAHYPFANKIYAGAEAERTLRQDVLVFCDSDTVFLSEPAALELPPEIDVAVAPAFHVNKASTGPDHRLEPYWQRVWELAGAPGPPPYVETMERRRRIRGYWNAGILAARRESGFLSEWLDLFRALHAAEHFPDGKMMVIDQVAIAGVVAKRPERFRNLDWSYNYNIARRPFYKGPAKSADLDRLVHVHYHQWFNRRRLLADLRPPLDAAGERYRWLDERLPLEPAIRAPLPRPGKSKGGWRARRLERLRRPLRHIGTPEGR